GPVLVFARSPASARSVAVLFFIPTASYLCIQSARAIADSAAVPRLRSTRDVAESAAHAGCVSGGTIVGAPAHATVGAARRVAESAAHDRVVAACLVVAAADDACEWLIAHIAPAEHDTAVARIVMPRADDEIVRTGLVAARPNTACSAASGFIDDEHARGSRADRAG